MLNKAAENGDPKALTELGRFYVAGQMVAKDTAKGVELLNKAASEQYTPAMLELGKLALMQNQYDEAIQWLNKAEEQSTEATLELAHIYLQDKSPVYDPKTGFYWY